VYNSTHERNANETTYPTDSAVVPHYFFISNLAGDTGYFCQGGRVEECHCLLNISSWWSMYDVPRAP
jgi:hypothetical protein